jgi:hypothetical protein
MKQHSRLWDLDKLIARANPRLDHLQHHEEDAVKIKKWLALADRMLDRDPQEARMRQRLRFGSL